MSEVAAAASQAAVVGVVASTAHQANSGGLDSSQQHAESGAGTEDSQGGAGEVESEAWGQTQAVGETQAGRTESEGLSSLAGAEIDANQAMGLALGPLWNGSGSGAAQLAQQEMNEAGAE